MTRWLADPIEIFILGVVVTVLVYFNWQNRSPEALYGFAGLAVLGGMVSCGNEESANGFAGLHRR